MQECEESKFLLSIFDQWAFLICRKILSKPEILFSYKKLPEINPKNIPNYSTQNRKRGRWDLIKNNTNCFLCHVRDKKRKGKIFCLMDYIIAFSEKAIYMERFVIKRFVAKETVRCEWKVLLLVFKPFSSDFFTTVFHLKL